MVKHSKEEMEKAILAGIIGVVVMVSVYMFLISPQMAELSKLKKEFQVQQDKLTEQRALIKKAKKRKENIANLKQEIADAGLVLPSEGGYSWFLELINLWGSSQDIKFDTIVPKEIQNSVEMVVGGKKYFSMDMEIALRGGYHQIGRLINQMENYSDSIYIKDISIVLEKDTSEEALIASLTVNLFVLSA